ncbi:MAG TPA: branched-chain amino acid transaminase [Candidatus Polarisedimenticolia bacterium]|nr:branched-chain amino acid transaminase [Candidatus Polarisedimenticolia bacterium]
MALTKTDKIWMNGRLVPWDQATIHILSHVVHYGSCIFEGIRCYETARGPAIFRLQDHIRRMIDGCRIYRMELPFTASEIEAAILATVRANQMKSCYIRPLAYRGYNSLGVNPFPCPVDVAIAVWPWGAYLGEDALHKGVDVMVSSWRREAPNTLPAMAKASANYMNSQLIKMEALVNGYAEGIALDSAGMVSEGSGENLFLVHGGTLQTPPISAAILPGITRNTIRQLAADLELPLVERDIPREMLYVADEVFFVGTASEVTPIRSIDKIPIGNGARGEVTTRLQKEFLDLVNGRTDDRHHWFTML